MNVQDLTGQTVGQYQILAQLGMGGMGAVYRAYQPTLKREVALKVLLPSIVNYPGAVERFEREAHTAAALEHPHIVPIFDYGSVNGITFVAMRLLTGGSLQDRLDVGDRSKHSLPALGEVSDILRQLAKALDYAHQNGVIHRDIKTSNVMFDEHGSAYLVDFGIAKLVDASQSLTAAGMKIGTPAYMSPEQHRGEVITPAVDQYSLGVVAYAMLTGSLPRVVDFEVGVTDENLREVPEMVRNVLRRALAKQPQDRFPTVAAFAEAFDGAIAGMRGQPTQFFSRPLPQKAMVAPQLMTGSGTTAQAQRKWTASPAAWVGGALTLLLLAAAAFLLSRGGSSDLPTATPTSAQAALSTATRALALVVLPTATATNTSTSTQTASPTPTPSATSTPTATATPTATQTDTPTTDAILIAQATYAAIQTATATAWTKTPTPTISPTPNAEETISAVLTAFHNDSLTLTATLWTPTPSPTLTTTPSPTPTPTPTITPSATPTPTATLTVTPLPTSAPLITSSQPSDDPLLAPLQNDAWIAQGRAFGDVNMVLVPIGCFMMGSDTGADNERPVHQQCFRWPFWIDRTEVTNEQYGSSGAFSGRSQPREEVTYFEAQAFCEARGARLPTEAEWEYAARGPDALVYPWGDSWDGDNLVYRDGSTQQPRPIGNKPGGASWVGAFDMAGNVWEWTSSLHMPYPYNAGDGRENTGDTTTSRVIKGGSWDFGNPEVTRAAWRGGDGYALTGRDDGIGFRCVRDYTPTDMIAGVDAGDTAETPGERVTVTPEGVPCPDSLPSRLLIGSSARVAAGRSTQRLRENPSLEAAQITIIPAGNEVVVLDGPVCADGYAWWKVVYDGQIGWTAEGSDAEYWIEPLDVLDQADEPNTSAPVRVNFFMVAQTFERGYMFYLERFGEIWVLTDDGEWRTYADTFNEGDAEFDPGISAPDGLQQPRRGFGAVWRNSSGVRDTLGWATGPEVPIDAARYEYDPRTQTHVLYGLSGERFELDDDGSWRQAN